MPQTLAIAMSLLAMIVVWLFGSFGPTMEHYKKASDWKSAGGWAASVCLLGVLVYFWWVVIAIPLGL